MLLATMPAAAQDGEPPSQLAELLGDAADAGFARALEPRDFVFPDDHGPHPEFRNEWWYVTGNLDADSGERFGFELTFFRFALVPSIEPSDSAWRTNQVYIAHLAVTDADNGQFFVAQRYSRGALGLAGAQARPFTVWIDDWRIESEAETWHLVASDADFGVDLSLEFLKQPVLNGIDGLSQKSAEPGNASYYYSVTRLGTAGTVRIGNESYRVSGLSWLDREWSTSALSAEQVGWDWFALQLSDGSELMVDNLRLKDGSRDPASAGTRVEPNGMSAHIEPNDIAITVLDTWESPAGGTYPSRWRVAIPAMDLDLTVTPVMADQELFTTVRYWEGAVDVEGQSGGQPVSGRGYVELTGYAR